MTSELEDFEDQFQARGANDLDQAVDGFELPDLSAQDFAEHQAGIIATALERTGLVEITDTEIESPTSVAFTGRVKTDNEKKFIDAVVFPIEEALDEQLQIYFGKRYFRKEGRRVFAWNIAFSGQLMKDIAQIVSKALDETMPRMEVMEAPLVGNVVQSSAPGDKKRGAAPVR